MTVKCLYCNETYRTQEGFNQHIRSQAHALRRLAGQLEADRKLSRSASKPTQKYCRIQSRPTCHKKGVPQTYPVSTQQSCIPCNRTFKDVSALNQHLQNSKSHRSDTLPLTRAQNVRIQTISRQTSVSTPDQRKAPLVDVNASTACPPQTPYHLGHVGHKQSSPWAAISGPDIKMMLQELASHCHSPEDLLGNGYPLSPYSAEDIAGLRRCRKCGRKS